MTVGGTIVTVGGGVQLLQLPDIDFTFLVDNTTGATSRKQKNSDVDDYGGAFSAGIETPVGHWGATPITGVVSGFFANVTDSQNRGCASSASETCFAEDIVDSPGGDSFGFGSLTARTHRDVYFWGVNGELRFGKRPAPLPDSGGYLFRFGYVGIGADVRGIDQDNRITIRSSDAFATDIDYSETLDTTYSGGFLSIGGEYNVLGYLGIGGSLGLRSFLTLKGGIYNASTDYSGRFQTEGAFGPDRDTRLNLSNDKTAFIGGASFETRKQFGARTSLSLLTDYEWFSYAPKMKYLDADPPAEGIVDATNISDSEAFAVRTQLRLNIGLGTQALYAEPMK